MIHDDEEGNRVLAELAKKELEARNLPFTQDNVRMIIKEALDDLMKEGQIRSIEYLDDPDGTFRIKIARVQ